MIFAKITHAEYLRRVANAPKQHVGDWWLHQYPVGWDDPELRALPPAQALRYIHEHYVNPETVPEPETEQV